jgi:hypothetical protein
MIYKKREELRLMKEIVSSSFITLDQLREIKKHYDEKVPYHNFLHALMVALKVLELLSHKDFNVIEIKSLFIAALFHDAWHTGMAEDLDEFRSLDLALEAINIFENKYNYFWVDNSIIRKAIIWTVFKNRWKNTNKYALIMADLDIHAIWLDFLEYLYYSDFWMALEIGNTKGWKLNIDEWFKNIWFFKFIMRIDKNIYRNKQIKNELLSKSLENITEYIKISKNNCKLDNNISIQKIFNYWKNNDITLEEFKNKFKQ